MKKICIVTGTRAEYGLLKPVIDRVYHANTMELHLVVTGMHLSPEFGLTYREIEEDLSQGALFFSARRKANPYDMEWFDRNLTWLFQYGGHEFYTLP